MSSGVDTDVRRLLKATGASSLTDLEDRYIQTRDENARLKREAKDRDAILRGLTAKFEAVRAELKRSRRRAQQTGRVAEADGDADAAGRDGAVKAAALPADPDHVSMVQDLTAQITTLSKMNAKLSNRCAELKKRCEAAEAAAGARFAHVPPKVDTGLPRGKYPPRQQQQPARRRRDRGADRGFLSERNGVRDLGGLEAERAEKARALDALERANEELQKLRERNEKLKRRALEDPLSQAWGDGGDADKGGRGRGRRGKRTKRGSGSAYSSSGAYDSASSPSASSASASGRNRRRRKRSKKGGKDGGDADNAPGIELDLLSLRREIREKAVKMSLLTSKYEHLQASYEAAIENHSQSLEARDKLNDQLVDERRLRLEVEDKLKVAERVRTRVAELEAISNDLRSEREMLLEENRKLTSDALSGGSAEVYNDRIRRLREEKERDAVLVDSKLEKVQEDLEDARLARERAERDAKAAAAELEAAVTERDELRERASALDHDLRVAEDKLSVFADASGLTQAELGRAMQIVRGERGQGGQSPAAGKRRASGTARGGGAPLDASDAAELDNLRVERAELAQELDKVTQMLSYQQSIGKRKDDIIAERTKHLETIRGEYEGRIDEMARLIDSLKRDLARAEDEMRNKAMSTIRRTRGAIADGAHDAEVPDGYGSDGSDISDLGRDENAFEFFVGEVTLDPGMFGGGSDPSTFATFDFFEHPSQITAAVSGVAPAFNFAAVHVVTVDDFFMHYLQTQTMRVSVHQAFGADHRVLGSCGVPLHEILDRPGRVVTTAPLVSAADGATVIGSLRYAMRMRSPITHEIRVYQERSAFLELQEQKRLADGTAAGSLGAAAAASGSGPGAGTREPASYRRLAHPHRNAVVIEITACNGLVARRAEARPSPYVYYEFFDFPGCDTSVAVADHSPVFRDVKTLHVDVTPQLKSYLAHASLEFVVFDDADTAPEAYIGVARVPLSALAASRPSQGTVQVVDGSGSGRGTLTYSISWLDPCGVDPPAPDPERVRELNEEAAREREAHRMRTDAAASAATKTKAKSTSSSSSSSSSSPPLQEHDPPVEVDSFPQARPEHGAESPSAWSSKRTAAGADSRRGHDNLDDLDERERSDLLQSRASKYRSGSEEEGRRSRRARDRRRRDARREEARRRRGAAGGASSDETSMSVASSVSGTDTSGIARGTRVEDRGAVEHAAERFDRDDRRHPSRRAGAGTSPRRSDQRERDGAGPGRDDLAVSVHRAGDEDLGFRVSATSPMRKRPLSPRRGVAPAVVESFDSITVTVHAVVLRPSLVADERINRLFVSFGFLGLPDDDLESPAMEKGVRPLEFNFTKVFPADRQAHRRERERMRDALTASDLTESDVFFSVVNEPQDGSVCYEIAVAEINMRVVYDLGEDLVNEELPLVDEDQNVLGSVFVTVTAVEAMRSMIKEAGSSPQRIVG